MKIISKHPAFFLAGSVVGPLAGIVLLPFLWKKLTPADYGLLATAELIMAFGASFIGLQQESSLNRLYFEWEDSDKNRRISTLLTLNFVSIVIFGLILLVLLKYIGGVVLPEELKQNNNLLLLFLGYLVILKQRNILNAYLRVTVQPLVFFIYNSTAVLVQVAFVINYVFIESLRLYGYILALLTAEFFVAIFTLTLIYRKTGFHFDLLTARNSMKFSLPLIPAAILSSTTVIVERSILLTYVPLSDMGIYSICQKVSSVIQLANNSIKMLFAPAAFEMVSANKDKSVVSRYRNKYLLAIILLSIATLPSMMFLTQFSGSYDYRRAEVYFPFFVLMGLFTSSLAYLCSGPFFTKSTNLTKYPPLVELITFVVLSISLAKSYNLTGVVAAKLLSTVMMTVAAYSISQKAFYIPIIIEKEIVISIVTFVAVFSLLTIN